jgi:hypothetical protein
MTRAAWALAVVLGACGASAEARLEDPAELLGKASQDAAGAPQGEPGPEGGLAPQQDSGSEPGEPLEGAAGGYGGDAEVGVGDAQADVRQALGAGGTGGAGGAGGTGGVVCAYESDARFCQRLGKDCGVVTGVDNCGARRTVYSCGECTLPSTCGAAGIANWCGCAPESDAAFCMRYSTQCGSLTGADNCNTPRTVASCGVCLPSQVCRPITPGVVNYLVCVYGR